MQKSGIRFTFALAATLILLPGPALAQSWTKAPNFQDRYGAAMAYDAARERVVVYGGGYRAYYQTTARLADTWEWDGLALIERGAAAHPGGTFAAMAFDSARGRTVALSTTPGETWEYDGAEWLRVPGPTPTSAYPSAMAYDVARQRCVLFDGQTWEWDGATWALRGGTQPGISGFAAAMAYDAARQRTVLVGGGQTWEWDGVNWQQRIVTPHPSGRPAMCYDGARQRCVLFDGNTWEWDGANWTQRMPTNGPLRTTPLAIAFDAARQRAVLLTTAGIGSLQPARTLWEWDGTNWSLARRFLPERSRHAMAPDFGRDSVVLFGGTTRAIGGLIVGDTWEWRGGKWHARTPAGSPPAREWHAMASDSGRGRVVLFGGLGSGGDLDDTWEWDGSNWAQANPAVRPSARHQHGMTFDPVRGRAVLFGGFVNDPTWEWDGTSWVRPAIANEPSGAGNIGLAYLPARQRTTLLLGDPFQGQQTWEWDGATWTLVSSGAPIGFYAWFGMCLDPVRQVVVAHGGLRHSAQWSEWDGAAWTTPTSGPAAGRHVHAMAWDPGSQRVLVHGGEVNVFGVEAADGETWLFGDVQRATVVGVGAGCPGSLGTPRLGAARPALGRGPAEVELSSMPANVVAAFGWSLTQQTTPLGAGCDLELGAPVAALPVITTANGLARTSLAVPASASFRGIVLYTQGAVLDLGAPLGFALSRALRLTIGD